MQSMLSDFALVSQLYAFMEVIPVLWSWHRLRDSYGNGETYTEQRGSENNFLQFEFHILEEGSKDGGQYLHVAVSVTDPLRADGQRGSSTTPMCTSFLFFESGE